MRCLSRPRRSDWSRAATGERAGCGRKTGRAVRRGLTRDKGGEWAAADASRGSVMAAAVPAGIQAVPGPEGGVQPLVAASEGGASFGGSDAGTAGFASNRRRGDPGV